MTDKIRLPREEISYRGIWGDDSSIFISKKLSKWIYTKCIGDWEIFSSMTDEWIQNDLDSDEDSDEDSDDRLFWIKFENEEDSFLFKMEWL